MTNTKRCVRMALSHEQNVTLHVLLQYVVFDAVVSVSCKA